MTLLSCLPLHFHYQLSLYFLILFNRLHRGLYCSLWFISVCCCAVLKIMKKWNEKSHLLSAEKNIFNSLSGGSSQEQQQHQYTEVNYYDLFTVIIKWIQFDLKKFTAVIRELRSKFNFPPKLKWIFLKC